MNDSHTKGRRLPEAEWKFDNLSQKDDALVRGIFLYEYFRQSKKLTALVLRCREMKSPAMFCQWPKGYKPLRLEARQLIAQETKHGESFEHRVRALVNCPDFPKRPALQLRDIHWLRELDRDPAVRLCGDEVIDADVGFEQAIDQYYGLPGIEYKFKGSVQAREFESVFPIVIDWRKSDHQVLDGVREKILVWRPKQFRALAKSSPKQDPFGSLRDKLPFKPGSALVWLGVLRRRDRAGTWRQYFELYYASQLRGSRPCDIKSTEIDALARPREEDCRKARLIIDWLENGTPLQPKAFR